VANGNTGHKPSTSPAYWKRPTLETPACAYVLPTNGTLTRLTPLLTWKRVPGAAGYYIVISRDARFTEVADVGFTNVPAYAPRVYNESPLADETTKYYWAVVPTEGQRGDGVYSTPCEPETGACGSDNDNPQSFNKSSLPPRPLAPAVGATALTQPTFRWSSECGSPSCSPSVENARSYRLQVALDPTFGHLIEDVTTDATAYTATSTYPTNTPLYWRVRANDWIGQGLNWSVTRSFTRVLPRPEPFAFNASANIATTPLVWSPLQGAIGYDVHIDQADGKHKDYSFASPSASYVEYYGFGFGHFEVRAEFPTSSPGQQVAGPYSAPMQSPVFTLPPPAGARGIRTGSRLLLTWKPVKDAKRYRVEVSTSNGFGTRIETRILDGTTWAPNVDTHNKRFRHALYWRVAAVDKRGGPGSFAAGAFRRH
jgi:hypothetical protein